MRGGMADEYECDVLGGSECGVPGWTSCCCLWEPAAAACAVQLLPDALTSGLIGGGDP